MGTLYANLTPFKGFVLLPGWLQGTERKHLSV